MFFVSLETEAEESFYLGAAWIGSSGLNEEITTGSMELLSELVPDLRVEIQGNLKNFEQFDAIIKRYNQEKDAIVLMGHESIDYLQDNSLNVPVFLGAINNPLQTGLIRNNERPGNNITGVSYYTDYGKFLSFMQNLIPHLDSVLLLLERGNPSSEADLHYMEQACRNLSIEFFIEECSKSRDIDIFLDQYSGIVDAVILGNQNFFLENFQKEVFLRNKIPSFSLNYLLVRKGVLASLAPDYLKLGRLLAGSIINVLYNGKKAGDIPIRFDSDPRIHINMSTSESLEVIIPIHMLRVAEVYH
ncbi:ABC transporter substrate-binding protein [Spirochaeta isovalerica]|uniref:Putative ABC transport system substrate-binding protein n=1 Tax=Spirochaeta isovalerica TaxID=150 RepID=A0A841R7J9_9SPIO|nr:ABC transporter substrate binding protein [Spirochaeta isovalerica]MBB6478718.1 putative ABC transport system substrate-binding protein [Spirochaeta isovalerica]